MARLEIVLVTCLVSASLIAALGHYAVWILGLLQ